MPSFSDKATMSERGAVTSFRVYYFVNFCDVADMNGCCLGGRIRYLVSSHGWRWRNPIGDKRSSVVGLPAENTPYDKYVTITPL